jgi:hypothetical protein
MPWPLKTIEVEGLPVVVRVGESNPRRQVRTKPKKRKKTFDYGIKRLNKRQIATLDGILKAKRVDKKAKIKAAKSAGYSPAYALQAANKALERKSIIDALTRHNVTDDKIAEVIAGGLGAMHPLTKGKQPDWHARDKFVKEANRIKDNYPATKIHQQSDTRAVHIHLTGADIEAGQKFREMRGEDAEA